MTGARARPTMSMVRSPAVLAVLGIGAAVPALGAIALSGAPAAASDLGVAGPDLFYSFVRMLAAYLASLGFALTYGYFASAYRTGERILIPVLDILQSIPILGFFPIAIVAIAGLTPHSPLGPNLASIFLIFTSMSWNMVFGVYESLKALPTDLGEAARSFDVHGWLRIRRVLLPATVNRLVYNSVLSWTGGWYFLVAAEFISNSSSTTALPGIGTYLLAAAASNDGLALAVGFALLVALIIALDILVWRPLGHWAERYRYDQTPSGESGDTSAKGPAPIVRAVTVVRRGVVTGFSRIGTPFVAIASRVTAGPTTRPRSAFPRSAVRYLVLGTILVLVWLLLITLIVNIYHVATGPISPMVRSQIAQIPLAIGLSGARLAAAYAICVAVTLPLAIVLVRRPRFSRFGLPVVQIVASVPATALFPALIFGVLPVIGSEATSILMLITGMIWYLFFNLLSGVRSIPPDLEEASRSYGVQGALYRRRLLFPAIFTAFVTGSITAFGGGWNTLIIAEYLRNGTGGRLFEVTGIGQLIDLGNAEPGGLALMAAALGTMVIVVVVVNELLWKPLYKGAVQKYRFD